MVTEQTIFPPESKEFRWYEGLAICLSMIGVQLCSEVINQWGLYFYSPSGGVGRTVYVSIHLVGFIFIIGTIWDAVSSPLVGALSDKTPTHPGRWRIIPIYGRRRPYIFFGALLMVGTMIGFWFPPVAHTSLINFIYGTVMLCAHWTLFSVAVIPLNALGPEIARSERARIALGTWTAVGMIVGLAFANALPGLLITALDPARVESHLELAFQAHDNSVAQQKLQQWLKQWQFSEEEVHAIISTVEVKNTGGDLTHIYIAGEWFEQIKNKAILNMLSSIFEEVGIVSFEQLPRKAFLAFRITNPPVNSEWVSAVRKMVGEILLSEVGKVFDVHTIDSQNAIWISSPMMEMLRDDDLRRIKGEDATFWKDKQIFCQGSVIQVSKLDGQWSPSEIGLLYVKLVDLLVGRNLIVPKGGESNEIIFSKGLTHTLALICFIQSMQEFPQSDIRWVGESFSPMGYRRVATVFALLSFVLFLLPVLLIRERYDSAVVQSEPLPWGQGLKDAFRNKPFMIYAWSFFLFTIGFLAVQRVLPYWAELGLDGDESTITMLLIPFIIVAIVSYGVIPMVARYIHMKWLMCIALGIIASGMPFLYVIGKLNVDYTIRTLMGMILFGYCGIGQAIIYVMMIPMLGDIIDYDEQFSGERREAVYNGLSAFIWKASMAGSIWLASQSMSSWGNSIEDYTGVLLVGPFAGLFGILGMILISFYPAHWRTKSKRAERDE